MDITGILALSATITSFLVALTLIQIGMTAENLPLITSAFAFSAISLAVFVIVEKKTAPPFVDLRLLKHMILMPSYILLIATGITMFMIYPTIVQLVRSPVPLGFGVGALLLFVGMAIGPALAGVYMDDQETVEGVSGSFPSAESYNSVFITSGLLSAVALGFGLILKRTLAHKLLEA